MPTDRKPLGSVEPDTRGRVSLIKYLPPLPGLYLVYKDPESGIIELHPLNPPTPDDGLAAVA